MKPSWRPQTGRAPQELILSLVQFNIFRNDFNDGAQSTLSKFADHTKLGGKADSSQVYTALQRDLLEKKADRNPVQFNKEKCKLQHLEKNNCIYKYMPEANHMDSSFTNADLRIPVGSKL